jgi:hypothetical protein
MRKTRIAVLATALTLGVSAPVVTMHAQEKDATQTAALTVPAYRPPLRGAPASRIGGAHRGIEGADWSVFVLTPDHTGYTTAEQPVLYWYTSKPVSQPVEVTLVKEGDIDPVLETQIPGPSIAGVQRLDLARWDIKLEKDAEYQWFVSVIIDPEQRSQDITAGGTIRRVDAGPETQGRLASATEQSRAFVYAEEGLWYDAIDALSQLIDANPKDETIRNQRISLLAQVGLDITSE